MRRFKELPGDKDGGQRKPGDLDAKVISLKDFTKEKKNPSEAAFSGFSCSSKSSDT